MVVRREATRGRFAGGAWTVGLERRDMASGVVGDVMDYARAVVRDAKGGGRGVPDRQTD